MNSIRLHPLASLLGYGEAENRKPTREGQGNFDDPCYVETVSAAAGMDGVFGDGKAGSWSDVNQGSRAGKGTAFMAWRPEEPCPEGASSAGEGAGMGDQRRAHPASGENADRGGGPPWGVRLPGLPLRARHEMAAQEEHGPPQGHDPGEDPAEPGAEHDDDLPGPQPNPARLV